jgi:diguanylate cyclase (GGDEF)-like protein
MASCAAIWIAIVAVSPSPEVVALGAGGGVITATLFLLIQGQQLRLRGLAETDPLTRLTNHGSFHEALARELARAERGGTPLSLVVFDLDDFKRLNDTHGHPYGDAVLRQAGERLRASIRSSDTAGRVGGEEFAVLLPGTGDALAFEVAERIRTAIAQVEVDDGRLSCSAGVAVYPDDAGDPEALFERGDAALYAAKRTGKARTYRWTSEMTPEKTRRRGERRRAGGRDGDNPSEG